MKKIKSRGEINEIEARETIEKTNKTKLVLQKDKSDKPLARLRKKGLNKIRNERGEIMINSTEIKCQQITWEKWIYS